jgi:hypothetical protein
MSIVLKDTSDGIAHRLESLVPCRPDPTPEPMTHSFSRQVRVWASLALGGFALTPLAALAAYVLTNDVALCLIPLGIGFFLVLFGVILWAALCHLSTRADGHLEQFRGGCHLVHWTYTHEEWRGYAQDEWDKTRATAHLPVLMLGVMGLCLGGLLLLAADFWILPLCGSAGVVLGWLVRVGALHGARKQYRRALERVDDTYLGPQAAFYRGAYHTWATLGLALESVALEVEEGRTFLYLTIDQMDFSAVLKILVPAGKEDEARSVIAYFQRR